ncbi:vWA domain-containing protein [Deinococcus sp.]|uniref:vWA domain-containing protein n=1 Tax=Deinococcus sp. TaxID=47478 RepID=UPI003C7AAA12
MTQSHPSPGSQPRPHVEFRPLRAALMAGKTQDLILLIRVHPAPALARRGRRPPLNLSLVLDRSGSMSGEPLEMAKAATVAALRQLRPDDRVSVVSFDDEVKTEVASCLARDPQAMIARVMQIGSGGSTALYGGWLEGGTQVAAHLNGPDLNGAALNRVILLSDGQANSGLTGAQEIARHVRGLAERGVSTTTMGFGAHYDENLLMAMATAGDGNFEHIEAASTLPTFFESELQGLTRTSGRTVSLGLEPDPEYHAEVLEVLNDLQRNSLGRFQMPNLVEGQPLGLVARLRLQVPEGATAVTVTRVRLAWTGLDGVRHTLRTQLGLPVLTQAGYDALPQDPQVNEARALLEMAERQRRAVAAMDAGDRAGAMDFLSSAVGLAQSLPAPSPEVRASVADSRALQEMYERGEDGLARKRALSQAQSRSLSKPRKS